MVKEHDKEKGYECPNCEEEKPEYREPCPACGYDDKKMSDVKEK